jgi:hypothetical protein
MARQNKVKIPASKQLSMIGRYAASKLGAQAVGLAFIVAWMILFQTIGLRLPLADPLGLIAGIATVIAGLAFFTEGLFLAIMPLGERCGLALPSRTGLLGVIAFAVVVGVTATLAEPAIGFLRTQGSATPPWRAPMLYYLLNPGAGLTIGAIALGVGVAVALGMLRFLKGWSLKTMLAVIMPVLGILSALVALDPRASSALGLAWDAGGITTGPVTVPIVMALGLGVTRLSGGKSDMGGFGVVSLASALPIIAVLGLALAMAPSMPAPMSQAEFYAPSMADAARFVTGPGGASADGGGAIPGGYLADAIKAILPLALVLLLTLGLILKQRIRALDEILLGLAFAVAGLFLFGAGMENGLASLGRETGKALPKAYTSEAAEHRAMLLQGIEEDDILRAFRPDGLSEERIAVVKDGETILVPFDRGEWEGQGGGYRYVPVDDPIYGSPDWGYVAVLAFAFVMGLGATLAEPSLAALGITLEEVSTGIYKRKTLTLSVAIGVGLGMAAGFSRILFDLPLGFILLGAYGLALVLTLLSSDDFAAIAWDSAGVTTGPVTVPLVVAAGLGIGSKAGVADAFGVLACASAFPILSVLASGLASRAWRGAAEKRARREAP